MSDSQQQRVVQGQQAPAAAGPGAAPSHNPSGVAAAETSTAFPQAPQGHPAVSTAPSRGVPQDDYGDPGQQQGLPTGAASSTAAGAGQPAYARRYTNSTASVAPNTGGAGWQLMGLTTGGSEWGPAAGATGAWGGGRPQEAGATGGGWDAWQLSGLHTGGASLRRTSSFHAQEGGWQLVWTDLEEPATQQPPSRRGSIMAPGGAVAAGEQANHGSSSSSSSGHRRVL
jgi:hypothetical protein